MPPSIYDAAQQLRDEYVQVDHVDRDVLVRLIDVALSVPPTQLPRGMRQHALELRDRFRPANRPPERDISREQERAAAVIEAEYGRSAIRHQADGSIVITGLLDDIEMRSVCVERDGRERWRA
jgi:hypothetical protein